MKFSMKNRALPLLFFLAALSFFGFAYTGYHFLSSREPDAQAPPDTTLTSKKTTVDSVYLNHVHAADIFIRQKKYEEALTELNKAITIKPNETLIKNKIVQTTGLLEQQKKDNAEFARLIASADDYFKTKAYLDAKSTYQLALDLKPGDTYAKERLNETMGLLRSQMAQNILYDVAVANADKFYEEGELDKAKVEYEKASQMLPSDQHAKERLNEIIKIQVDRQVKEELYNQAITKGDQLYHSKKYSGALTEFRNALKQKPDEKYPQDRVKELTDLLNQMRALDEAYQNALATADQHFVGKRYTTAKTGYQEALKIKPEEVYPKNRIKEIDDILASIERSGAEYDQYIALADSFYIEKNFIRARQNYQLALKVKPNEAYPKEMLSKTDQGEAVLEQMKKTLEEQYAFLITNADQLLAGKEYTDARAKYTEALGLKPSETYPKTKLAEIETALASIEKQKSLDEKYLGLITEADQLLGEQSYEPAKTKYQAASNLKPSEEYPKTKIKEIDEALAAIGKQKTLDQQYQRVIAEADQLLGNKSYEKARTTYQSASDLKPAEEYPKTRITEIEGILAAAAAKQKELDDQYASVITNADQLLAAKEYDNAKIKYTEALGLKPAETYPKTKIAEIDAALQAIAQQKSLDEQYQGMIATADQLFGEKSYDQAKAKYQSAVTLKPAEEYPKTRIAEIDRIVAEALAQQKALDEQYNTLIAGADKLFDAKTYEEAKTGYQQALNLKPAEKYPQDRIARIDVLLGDIAKLKALDDQYASVIAGADQLLAAKEYDGARTKYTEALGLKPAETYPKTKIAEIDAALQAIAQQKSLDEQYQGVISTADQLFGEKSYDQAKAKYQSAVTLKPAEEYPKTRIAEIDRIVAEALAQQKALDEQYNTLIAGADKLFDAKTYEEAKTGYQQALNLKPAEKYPQDRIARIDVLLGDIAKQKALDDQYASVIANADQLLAAKDYDNAKTKYTEALGLKPAETYPKTKIAEIDAALQAIAQQKSLDEQYQGVISTADQLFGEKSYDQAKAKYQAAATLKPAEAYPKTRIAEIDRIVAEAIAKQKALDEQYNTLIAGADKLFDAKTYEEAKSSYQAALDLKPSEKYPQDRLSQIGIILAEIAKQKALDDQYASVIAAADQFFSAKDFAQARTKYQEASGLKPLETYPKAKIIEIDAALDAIAKQKLLDDQYQSVISEADRLFGENLLDQAKEKFMAASGLKPAEAYPKTRIAEIDRIVAEAAAKQKALDQQYNTLIAGADKLFDAKTYEEAKSSYQAALDLKPSEKYPQDRLSQIGIILAEIAKQKALDDQYASVIAGADQLLAAKDYDNAKTKYTEALGLKPAEAYPKTKITEIDAALAALARQKEMNDAYAAAIASGDKLFTEKSYPEAKTEYQKALSLKPAETYPKDRIAEADKMLAEIARLKAIEEQYASAITKADQLFTGQSYPEAKTEYQHAIQIRQDEQYPKDRIAEIDRIISEQMRLKTLNDQYNAEVSKADQLLNNKQYEPARAGYVAAQAIKPDDQYAKEQIEEIDKVLAEIKVRDESYLASITKADQLFTEKKYEDARTEYQNAGSIKPQESYPKEKIGEVNHLLTELQGKKVTYDNLMKSAADKLAEKEYLKSKDMYQQASGIFPEESLPKERIAYITKTVDSIYRVNRADYDRCVANGDKFFSTFEFDKSIDAYTEASGYLPMENYPKEQIAKIRRTIAEHAIVDVLKSPVTVAAGDEKKFSFEPVNIASRKDNFIYLKIKNLSGKPFNILMRYGQDNQSNGGVVLRNVTVDGNINERLISVKDQDLWYRADNNWISIYPQGGDVEVSFIQVSKVR